MGDNMKNFFGCISSDNDVSEEIHNMVKNVTLNNFKCEIVAPSRLFRVCVPRSNGIRKDNGISLVSKKEITVLISGEVYNLSDLKAELRKLGRSTGEKLCDTVCSAYETWGKKCFSKLNGMYVIVLWDNIQGKVYLSRDSYGTKSLYYHVSEKSGLTFSTKISFLFSRRNISRDINLKSLQEYLRFLDISSPNTIFEKIYSLAPGRTLEYDGKNCSIIPVTEVSRKSVSFPSFGEAVNELEDKLTRSLKERLYSGKTGFFLSGGIDSSALCALGAIIAPDRIESFTVGFEDEGLNEIPAASRVAKFLGIRHHELYFDIGQYFDAFYEIMNYIDSPFADPAVIPTKLCFDYCKNYVDVAIDGTGSDGLFGDMPPRYIRYALNYSSKLPEKLREKILQFMRIHDKLNDYAPVFDFEEPQELLIRWKGWRRKEIEELCDISCDFNQTTLYKVFNENSKSNALNLYSVLLSNMPDDRIHEMANLCDLTVRFPFWDKDVVNFVKRLPDSYKYKEGAPKRLLRELLSRYVPEALWNKSKQGFNFPFELLLKFNDFEMIKKYLNAGTLKRHGFFNGQVVKDYVNRYMNGDTSLRFKIWNLIVFQAWFLRHYQL
jgi:asparagine synthase (glutamine-hydrolysing)